ncbi:MAG: hypothetical protein ABIA04_14685 [Pseudomonadota bacterium]
MLRPYMIDKMKKNKESKDIFVQIPLHDNIRNPVNNKNEKDKPLIILEIDI